MPHLGWRFWFWHLFVPLVLFSGLVFLSEHGGWDLTLSEPFYDPGQGGWYLKKSWWAEGLIHKGGQKLVFTIAAFSLLAAVLATFRPQWQHWRRPCLYLALCIGLGTGAVAMGKLITHRHCPWSIAEFGGTVPYSGLFEPVPESCGGKGRCFPAGHASGGFSLMGGYFIFRNRRPGLAAAGLILGLSLGSLFGFGQVARGAHFVSHNLWSAMICWLVALTLYVFPFHGRLLDTPVPRSKGNVLQ